MSDMSKIKKKNIYTPSPARVALHPIDEYLNLALQSLNEVVQVVLRHSVLLRLGLGLVDGSCGGSGGGSGRAGGSRLFRRPVGLQGLPVGAVEVLGQFGIGLFLGGRRAVVHGFS